MKRDKVRIVSPASSANLGPGFDVFSVALEEPCLVIEAEKKEERGVIEIINQGPYAGEVSSEPDKHSGARALSILMREKKIDAGFSFKIEVNIPPRKGLGISGAEAVGFIYAADKLLGLNLSDEEIIHYASGAEPGGHLDNVSASTLGGFVAILRDSLLGKLTFRKFTPPDDLGFVVIVPSIGKASTKEAREALPRAVDVNRYVEAAARCSLLSYALATGDVDLLLEVVSYDPYAETFRADAGVYGAGIDGKSLAEEKKTLLRQFHVAETISGAGPSRLLWFKKSENRQREKAPITQAVNYVVDNLEKQGHRITKIIETSPRRRGCEEIKQQ